MLEIEFERAFPYLYRQAQSRKPDDNWSIKAPLVPHLEAGLAKMQQEAGFSRTTPGNAPSTADEAATASGGGGGGVRKSYTSPETSTWRPTSVTLPEYTPYPETPDHVGGGRAKSVSDYQQYQSQQQHLGVWPGAAGAALHKASSSTTLRGGKSPDEPSLGPGPGGPASAPTSMAQSPRGRSGSAVGGKSWFTRILQSGRPDPPPR
jgi:hypothetical protein